MPHRTEEAHSGRIKGGEAGGEDGVEEETSAGGAGGGAGLASHRKEQTE